MNNRINNILVSIVVPIYNPGYLLKSTLESICNQTHINIEILLVDDGSTDDSKKIINKFVKYDRRIKYYKQNNKGVCSARNYGIKAAKGTYIMFVDDDDILYKDTIKKVLSEIIKKNYDFLKFSIDYKVEDHSRNYMINDYIFTESKSIDRENISDNYLYLNKTGALIYVWNGIYKKEFLLRNNVFFDDSNKYRIDDQSFNQLLINNCEKFLLYKESGYLHISRYGKSDATRINFYKYEQSLPDYFNLEYEVAKNLKINNFDYSMVFSKEIGSFIWSVTEDSKGKYKKIRECISTVRNELIYIENIKIFMNMPLPNLIILYFFKKKNYFLCINLASLYRLITFSSHNSRPKNRKDRL